MQLSNSSPFLSLGLEDDVGEVSLETEPAKIEPESTPFADNKEIRLSESNTYIGKVPEAETPSNNRFMFEESTDAGLASLKASVNVLKSQERKGQQVYRVDSPDLQNGIIHGRRKNKAGIFPKLVKIGLVVALGFSVKWCLDHKQAVVNKIPFMSKVFKLSAEKKESSKKSNQKGKVTGKINKNPNVN